MSLRIIKLAITSNQRVTTSPSVTRLFHEVSETIPEMSTYKIGAAEFFDDSGEVVQSLPTLNMDNNYFNVYINGALQMDDNFAYTAGEDGVGSLMVTIPENSEITQGTPITLEVVNFYPTVQTSFGT